MENSKFAYVIYIRTTPEKLWEALTKPEFTWLLVRNLARYVVGTRLVLEAYDSRRANRRRGRST